MLFHLGLSQLSNRPFKLASLSWATFCHGGEEASPSQIMLQLARQLLLFATELVYYCHLGALRSSLQYNLRIAALALRFIYWFAVTNDDSSIVLFDHLALLQRTRHTIDDLVIYFCWLIG